MTTGVEAEIITRAEPFADTAPLVSFLETLNEVVEYPDATSIENFVEADAHLTSKAVLFPHTQYVPGEGYRVYGYKPCALADGITTSAHLAQFQPNTQEYVNAYRSKLCYIGETTVSFVDGKAKVDIGRVEIPEDQIRMDMGSFEVRKTQARGVLISLGGHLAVSGAFYASDVKLAYELIDQKLETLGVGAQGGQEAFAEFGRRRIGRDLLNQYSFTLRNPNQNPISVADSKANIEQAWEVVGKPFGPFAKLLAYVGEARF